MGETDAFEAYRLQMIDHDGPKLLVDRTHKGLKEAFTVLLEELYPNGPEGEPDWPEDGFTLEVVPVTVSGEEWQDAAEFEWEGFMA